MQNTKSIYREDTKARSFFERGYVRYCQKHQLFFFVSLCLRGYSFLVLRQIVFNKETHMKAKATYSVKKWEENTYNQISPEMKMTKASVEYEFSGDLEGKASVEYLMFYSHIDPADQHKSSASYLGLIRFDGKLAGHSGSFVMKDEGKFEGGTAESALKILEGSGTASLKGVRGTGMYRANKAGLLFEMQYDLA
jgi:hypothetical protein